MEVVDPGHSYILHNLGGGKQQLEFIKKSNGCIEHEEERDGVLVQEVLRVLVDRMEYLQTLQPCTETNCVIERLQDSIVLMEERAWRRKNQGVTGTNGEHDSGAITPIPYRDYEVFNKLPLGKDGHVIPEIPKLEAGTWYTHGLGDPRISSPAAFLDPETKLDWYSRDVGKIEGVMIKDIDWAECKEYRRHDALDTAVEGFGMF